MSISMTRYVDITSGVGGAAVAGARDLCGRVVINDLLCPNQSILEFTSAADVADYFGVSSIAYLQAVFYFGFTSKLISRPKKIQFFYWNGNVANEPRIYGGKTAKVLADFTNVTAGNLNITLNGVQHTFTGVDLSAEVSLAGVAAEIQSIINAYVAGGTPYTAAAVSYDATRGSFSVIAGDTGDTVILNTAATAPDVGALLEWQAADGAVICNGSAAITLTQRLIDTTDQSNNFGSFCLAYGVATDETIVEASEWNATNNVLFQFHAQVSTSNAAAIAALVAGNAGTGLTLNDGFAETPEMLPMAILAATNYSKRNSVQNYMFQQYAAITPSITTNAAANVYDALRVNYYGQTQQAGQLISFYQRGDLMGGAVDPIAMNIYANEQWLKDDAGVGIINLLLALARVSANAEGRGQILATLQSTIDRALFNGTISVGKQLTTTQKLYISEQTGDDLAWYQVQTIGYWLDCVIESYQNQSNATEYKAVYTLIYSKDDAIRKVDGTHVLI